jgi:dihydrofolate reductase
MRPGGTTFYFINDGIESALGQARSAVGNCDIRITRGAESIQQYLRAGLVDEFTLAISPVMLARRAATVRGHRPATSPSSSSRPSRGSRERRAGAPIRNAKR